MPDTPMPEAVKVVAVRWQCPHCRRTRAKRPATEAHIARCWSNPAVQSCRTCTHHTPASDACGCTPGCNWGGAPIPPGCNAGQDTPDDGTPRTHRPAWTSEETNA